MSDENYKVQVSINGAPASGVDYHKGAMANFRGDTVDEVHGQLEAARDAGLLELASEVESIWLVASGLGARTVKDEPAESAPADSDKPVATIHRCQHGNRVYKSGEKNGKKWEGYFCPSKNRSEQCAVEWAN